MKTILNLKLLFLLVNLEKFWRVPEVLTLIIENTTMGFYVIYGCIVLSLLATSLRNIVYKVLNLGVMSIFIAIL